MTKISSLHLTALQKKLSSQSKVNQSDTSIDSRQIRYGGYFSWDFLVGASSTIANLVELAPSSVLQSISSREGSSESRQLISDRINKKIKYALRCESIENADLKMRSGRVKMHQVANAILAGARRIRKTFHLVWNICAISSATDENQPNERNREIQGSLEVNGCWGLILATMCLAMLTQGALPAMGQGFGVDPDSINFGSTVSQIAARSNISILNSAPDTTTISWIRLEGNGKDRFLVDRRPFSLAPGESRNLLVQFLPEIPDTFRANLILGNSDQEIAIPLIGVGYDPYAYLTATHWSVLTNARLGTQGSIANLSPGASISLLFNYHSWSRTGCPGCIIYITAGVEADGQGAYHVGIPGRYPGRTGSGNVGLQAPGNPGVYTVYSKHEPAYTAGSAIAVYESAFLNPSFMPVAMIAVVDPNAPEVPTNLAAEVSTCNNIALSWDRTLTGAPSKYHIYRGILPFALSLVDSVDQSTTNYVDHDVLREMHYYYRVRAVDSLGRESGFSGAADPTTGPQVVGIDCPLAPLNASVIALGDSVCIDLPICNADSVYCSIGSWNNNTFCFRADSLGSYQITTRAFDKNENLEYTCTFSVNVSGVKVGNETVQPGGTVRVPITLFTDLPLSGFTIPLKYSTTQPGNVTLDSVSVVPWVGDSAYIVNDSVFIVHRPVQPIPMPDSTGLIEVGYAYFKISNAAAPEIIPIDTTTAVYNAVTYSYQFITVAGDTIVPLFVPGSVTIEGVPPVCDCGDFNCSGGVNIADAIYLVNYIFADSLAPQDGSGGDINCNGQINIADAVYLVNFIFSGGPAPCANCPYMGSIEKSATGSIELWIEEIDSPTASYVLKVKTDISIAGLQFEMTTDHDPNLEAAAMKDQMSLFSSFTNGKSKVGLVDLTAAAGILAGEHELFRWQKGGSSEPVLSNALAANRNAEPVDVKILGAKRGNVLPTVFAIDQNYPNPFNPSTEIVYAVPRSEHVRVEVFNVLGQHVATLVNAPHQAGRYSVAWDSRDDNGRDVASGVYLYRMTAGDFVSTKKMMLLK